MSKESIKALLQTENFDIKKILSEKIVRKKTMLHFFV